MPTVNLRVCPHCGEEIDHIEFKEHRTEFGYERGSCDFDGENMHYNGDYESYDGETTDTEYLCPECGEEFFLEDLEAPDSDNRNEEEEEPTELNEDGAPLVQVVVDTEGVGFVNCRNSSQVTQLICHACGYRENPIEDGEQAILCVKCGEELTKDNSEAISFGKNDL